MMRNSKHYWFILFIIGLIISSCESGNEEIANDSYIAFSLRVAQEQFQRKSGVSDSNAFTLGGITRLVGMVIDRENKDIILIGKKIAGLPAARFDDLVVALRARMRYNDLPMVSIDLIDSTPITGMQKVRFGGKIERTLFGKDFLECDILLKKYSLELEQQISTVDSYRKLLVNNELIDLRESGINPIGVRWVNIDSLKYLFGKITESGKSYQARFWFNYSDPYKVRILDDVFCIMSLDICIQNELKSENQIFNEDVAANARPTASIQFMKLFTENFYKLSEAYPQLKRTKLLFDITALAEGLKNTNNLPDINFLLMDYPVQEVETPKEFALIKQCAIIDRSDGKTNLIQVSGGIETSVELEWLNGGNIGYLKKFVKESRPDKNSLFWKIPVDNWEMPNSNGLTIKSIAKGRNSKVGCSVVTNSVVLGERKSDQGFNGFTSNQHFADPIQTKGVQMKMEIDSSHFCEVDSLKNLRTRFLK